MTSVGSKVAETLFRLFVRPPSTHEAGERVVREAFIRPASFAPPRRLRRDVAVECAYRGDWPVYRVSPLGSAAGRSLVYVHGGAFVGEIIGFHWRMIARIAAETGVSVVVPIYPLVPRGTAQDVVETVAALLLEEAERVGTGDVSVAGDSAGGNIALAAALQVRDAGVRLRRTVLIHPAVDLSLENPAVAGVEAKDPLLRTAALRPIIDRWRGDLDVHDARVSPIYGDMAGLGPMTIFSGTHDITNPDTRLLVEKVRAAGVDVDFHEGAGLIHPSPALPTREGREARMLIVKALE